MSTLENLNIYPQMNDLLSIIVLLNVHVDKMTIKLMRYLIMYYFTLLTEKFYVQSNYQ